MCLHFSHITTSTHMQHNLHMRVCAGHNVVSASITSISTSACGQVGHTAMSFNGCVVLLQHSCPVVKSTRTRQHPQIPSPYPVPPTRTRTCSSPNPMSNESVRIPTHNKHLLAIYVCTHSRGFSGHHIPTIKWSAHMVGVLERAQPHSMQRLDQLP